MIKFLSILILFQISLATFIYSQDIDDVDELYPMREEMADRLFPEENSEWKDFREAFLTVKRERFIDGNYRSIAYKNMPVPIKGGLIQPSPEFIANILKETLITPMSKVLIIGRNTQYFTALLSEITENLFVSDPLAVSASADGLSLRNDLDYYGWIDEEPFDFIILFGSVEVIPQNLISQLRIRGKLIAPISYKSGSQLLISATKYSNGFDVMTIGDSYIHSLRNSGASDF